MSNSPRVPLHLQHPSVMKALKDNPSYESFRPNEVHPQGTYREMEERPGLGTASRVRRYPDGRLDFKWTLNQIIDALRKLNYNGDVLPIEAALITAVLPLKFRMMEPQQAEILTQLSKTEKDALAVILDSWMSEVENWNAGQGGGSTPGRHHTDVGG